MSLYWFQVTSVVPSLCFCHVEVLADPAISARLADTKAISEVKTLDAFYQMLQTEPDRAFYGYAGKGVGELMENKMGARVLGRRNEGSQCERGGFLELCMAVSSLHDGLSFVHCLPVLSCSSLSLEQV